MIPTYEQALAILEKYNKSEALLQHGKIVSAVMRYCAGKYDGDAEIWAVVGLLHDLDYEMYPEEHCKKGMELMREEGLDDVIIRACASHGHGICIDLEPQSDMEKVLYAIDELTGLIHATAIMRPSKSVMDLEVKSVKKKFKTRSFAAGVDRDLVLKGAENLGLDIDTLMDWCIQGMRLRAEEIGLKGE